MPNEVSTANDHSVPDPEAYDSGTFLIRRLGAERHLDLELVAVLTQLRQELIKGIDNPTAGDHMLVDTAVLAYRNVLRILEPTVWPVNLRDGGCQQHRNRTGTVGAHLHRSYTCRFRGRQATDEGRLSLGRKARPVTPNGSTTDPYERLGGSGALQHTFLQTRMSFAGTGRTPPPISRSLPDNVEILDLA